MNKNNLFFESLKVVILSNNNSLKFNIKSYNNFFMIYILKKKSFEYMCQA